MDNRHYHVEIREDNKKVRVNFSMFKREKGFIASVEKGYYKWKVVYVPTAEGKAGMHECTRYIGAFQTNLFQFHDYNAHDGKRQHSKQNH